MSETAHTAIAVVGIDISKSSFHVVGLDGRGAIVLRQKWWRGQIEGRFANMPVCIPKTRFAEISMAWVNERRNRMTVRARRALKLGNGSLGHGSAD